MSHVLIHSPIPQPAKKLRSCLSPSRTESAWDTTPVDEFLAILRPSSTSSEASSTYTEIDGQLVKRPKAVHWQGGDGCAVTSYFATWSAQDYDRTPLAPPSESERACVMPARGDRCLSFNELGDDADDDDDESDSEPVALPRSPFATPEESDTEEDEDEEWTECCERRRMMFARMCPLSGDDAQPQFEGYRSLSATLRDLLASVEDSPSTPERDTDASSDEEGEEPSSSSSSFPISSSVFSRLREDSVDTEVGTPSLVSSADSDGECSGLASPRGSAVDFLPMNLVKGGSPVRGYSDRERDFLEHTTVL